MQSESFELEILTPERADVFVACPAGGAVPWQVVRRLDESCVRAIADARDSEPDGRRVRRIIAGCSALVAVLPHRGDEACSTSPELVEQVSAAAELGLPILILREQGVRACVGEFGGGHGLQLGDAPPIMVSRGQVYGPAWYVGQGGFKEESCLPFEQFLAAALKRGGRGRPYAFFVGRLERDFAHAREAVRAAVESEAGIPCLWSDDSRHRLEVDSIRERTRLLIRHSAFVIADLTLGKESPERENPSRAHEIGMTIAYGRKLMLCSQEPRRYPYFSISDMQMSFWSDEAELESQVREWIRTSRDSPARTVLNYGLAEAAVGAAPRIKEPTFTFEPAWRFVGPNAAAPPCLRAPAVALSAAAVCLALVHLLALSFGLGGWTYWAAYFALVFAVFLWPHLRGGARGGLWTASPVVQVLALAALTLMTLALAAVKAP